MCQCSQCNAPDESLAYEWAEEMGRDEIQAMKEVDFYEEFMWLDSDQIKRIKAAMKSGEVATIGVIIKAHFETRAADRNEDNAFSQMRGE